MPAEASPIERQVFETQTLVTDHPPVWRHRNKVVVYGIACPPGCEHRGQLSYSRWTAMALPEKVDVKVATSRVEGREDVYDYVPTAFAADAVEWHVNFADPHLFVAYGSSLFAQDEMQVAEHPALGSLLEALKARHIPAVTVDHGQPTPVLVTGVERRCRIAMDRNAEEGRPKGLYGNAFASASEDAIRKATTRIDPPTVTNIIAMAAPAGGYGPYSATEIDYVLSTAFTGFRAAILESRRPDGSSRPVVVRTGFWGCGAFGGNRTLMALLQALAAEMAGIDRLVFHTVDRGGSGALKEALTMLDRLALNDGPVSTASLLADIVAMGFKWGVSDGN